MPFRVELVGISGLPTGGATGEVLTKNSGSDYDSDWAAPSGDGDFKANGTIPMTADLNCGTHKIVGVVDPTSAQHAATKKYVDDVAVVAHAYTPGTAGDWAGTAPTTLVLAIDRLAALVKILNSGTGA